MKLKTGNPRVRGPRNSNRHNRNDRGSRRTSVEPSTFAWTEPLADVEPLVVEREVVVERAVEKPVVVEKQVYVDRPVPVERQIVVEKPVLVEKPVVVEKIVEKVVEKEVVVEKPVYVDRAVEVEKKVFVEQPAMAAAATEAAIEAKPQAEQKPAAKKTEKTEKQPKAIIIGRGPSLASKLARIAPKPTPVLAGAAAALIAIVGVALVSPSSDNADAARAGAAFTSHSSGSTGTAAAIGEQSTKKGHATSSRDPFAARNYKAPAAKPAAKNPAKSGTAAKAPTVATPSLYAANFTTYSSFTPWAKSSKRSGNWIDFGGKPTVKVLSVGKNGVDLFVVTDVEVISDKSKNIKYDNPLRQVHVAKDGVVRFADYRDIQGDDVTYTIRYGGSKLIKLPTKK